MSKFEFKKLPYAFDALEPHIDAKTMEVHYEKHHKGYHGKFLKAIEGTDFEGMCCMHKVFENIDKGNTGIRNNGGGYFNHDLFWSSMSPNGGGNPKAKVLEAINKAFGSFDAFKEKFSDAAATRFGSGWAWLIVNKEGKLEVCSTANQDNPLMKGADNPGEPILGLDVWEHAYYLKYQNRRPDYIGAFWNVVNWDAVEEAYEKALAK